jgi:hypothetical protein
VASLVLRQAGAVRITLVTGLLERRVRVRQLPRIGDGIVLGDVIYDVLDVTHDLDARRIYVSAKQQAHVPERVRRHY